MNLPLLTLFSRDKANFSSTYTRTRNGRREVVRKSKNRLKVERGRLSARVSVPVERGEVYGLGVLSVRRDRRNIREQFVPSLGSRGAGLNIRGNVGSYQVKARTYGGYNPNFSEFNTGETYTRRTKTGKMAIIRKGKRRSPLSSLRSKAIIGTALGGTVLGIGALALALKGKGNPGMIKKVIRSSSDDVARGGSKLNAEPYLEKARQSIGSSEDVARNLNNPNYTWEF